MSLCTGHLKKQMYYTVDFFNSLFFLFFFLGGGGGGGGGGVGWMDNLRLYVLFNSISVILGR